MSPPGKARPKSAIRIITLLLSISFLGVFIAGIACYVQPKTYESTGVFAEWEAPGQSIPVAGAHAATIVSQNSLHLRWGIPFEDAVEHVKEIVTMETTAAGTVIRARSTSGQTARIIVGSLMKTYPGFERERQWAQTEGLEGRYTEREVKTQREVDQLRLLVLETLQNTGNDVPGSLVTPETVARLGNEDLTRQFKAYRKAAQPIGRFAPPDGNISLPPPVAAEPFEPQKAISPDIDTYFLVGRIGGLIAAVAALITILHRKPSLLEVPHRKPAPTAAWAEIRNEVSSDHPTW